MKKKDGKEHKQDRCWNSIGVWGAEAHRCPELERVVHCRNCEVFIRAGRELLNRQPPEGYLEEWTALLAEPKRVASADTVSVFIFRLGDEWLALPTGVCREIVEVRSIHRVPHRSDELLLGLVNVHGELQLCISLHEVLGITQPHGHFVDDRAKTYQRMMIVEKGGTCWIFRADETCGAFRYGAPDLQDVPATVSKAGEAYTRAVFSWQGKRVGHLDDALLFATLDRRMA